MTSVLVDIRVFHVDYVELIRQEAADIRQKVKEHYTSKREFEFSSNHGGDRGRETESREVVWRACTPVHRYPLLSEHESHVLVRLTHLPSVLISSCSRAGSFDHHERWDLSS